jgi:tRNA nucleotidyltransferase (CCA-adding enzyme)
MIDKLDIHKTFDASFDKNVGALLHEAATLADQQNRRAVMVGGAVRDLLLGRTIFDADVMVEHPAEPFVTALAERFQAKITSHERFQTFTIHLPSGEKIDVVTARTERYAMPAQLPDVTPSTIEMDIKRRDFTINAMAVWLNKEQDGRIYDPFKGQDDLQLKQIRVLHPLSFVDDPTRVFRAARFAGRLGFTVESKTERLIIQASGAKLPSRLSPVRRRHELELILKEPDPLVVLDWLDTWGLMTYIFPELYVHPWYRENPFPPRKEGESNADFLTRRLLHWFRAWGPEKTRAMLSALQFENTSKNDILSLL